MISMTVKISNDFYRHITQNRTYEFEKNRTGNWNVSVYSNDQNLNEDEAFISKESGGIKLITEADDFVSNNEKLIVG